jgi:hypothetical protein
VLDAVHRVFRLSFPWRWGNFIFVYQPVEEGLEALVDRLVVAGGNGPSVPLAAKPAGAALDAPQELAEMVGGDSPYRGPVVLFGVLYQQLPDVLFILNGPLGLALSLEGVNIPVQGLTQI